ncbi:MAG: hypothetical protein V7640_1563 [Betaproteobacteria bacterium]|jgi:hypothetical protein
MPPELMPVSLKLLVVLITLAPLHANADLYRWTDEKGSIHYSDRAPPKSSNVKDVSIVENRLSVYSQDKATMDRVQRARERADSISSGYVRPDRYPVGYAQGMAPAPGVSADPCLAGDDVNCYGYPLYYSAPVFFGRHRGARFVQPRLPLGATAGNAVGPTGFIPGLSAQAQALASTPMSRSAPIAPFTPAPARTGGGQHSR